MANYFEALTDNGEVKISDDFSNYVFAGAKKLKDCVYWGTDYGYQIYLLGTEWNDGIVFLYNPSDTLYTVMTGKKRLFNGCSYSQWRAIVDHVPSYWSFEPQSINSEASELLDVYGTEYQNTISIKADKSIADEFIVFYFNTTSKTPIPTGDVGLMCYDASGNVVFSSNDVPMLIKDFGFFLHSTSERPLDARDWEFINLDKTYTYPVGLCIEGVGIGGATGEVANNRKQQYFQLSRNRVKTFTDRMTDYNKGQGYQKDAHSAIYIFCGCMYHTLYNICDLTQPLKKSGMV